MFVGQPFARRCATVIDHQIVVGFAVAAQCLRCHGAAQYDDMVFVGCPQRQFALVVVTIRVLAAAMVIDLEVDGIFWKYHDWCRISIDGYQHFPYGIEPVVLFRQHLIICGIERALSVSLRVPALELIVHAAFGVVGELEVRCKIVLVGLEHLYAFCLLVAVIGVQCHPYGVGQVSRVGVHDLFVQRMAIDELVACVGHRRKVLAHGLAPQRIGVLRAAGVCRATEQPADVTAVEAEFGDIVL